MKFTVSNVIRIDEPTEEVMDWAHKNLVVPNPMYQKKQKMGLWLGKTPENLCLYSQYWHELVVPFGCLNYLWKTYRTQGEFKPSFPQLRRVVYGSSISLREYQEEAVQAALKARNGVIVMPCGSGKTQTALELIARIGGRALWIAHTADLIKQSEERAKANFDLPDSEYGHVTEGKIQLGAITFATIQTLCKVNLDDMARYFDVIVVDEAHHCVGSDTNLTMYQTVLSRLCARYKYGVTATPTRQDGLTPCMYALLGDEIINVPRAVVAEYTVPITVYWHNTGWQPNKELIVASDGTLVWSKLVQQITSDEIRNTLICEQIKQCHGSTLVLSERVEHLRLLYDLCKDKLRCVHVTAAATKRGKEVRATALKRLNDGELDVVFATYQLAKEGLDCPNLRNVVMASPIKEPKSVEQAVGRVQRKASGKEFGVVVDFVDDFGLLYGYVKKRKSIYKKLENCGNR